MKISFHGGAREVTGSCFLLETGNAKILVDCGLFQGSKEFEDLNDDPFKFDPKSIDALIVSHGHLDHIGRIPKLVRDGFRGIIFSTAPTKDLARLVLEDALSLAERRNNEFYSHADLEKSLSLWRSVSFGERMAVKDDISFILHEAGHILGSAIIAVEAEGKKFLFSGDLGNIPSALLVPPRHFPGTEYLIVESTYGNRTHESADERVLKLERAVEDAAARRGTLMIPAFATERTQDILYLLNDMLHKKRIPEMPVFVDAPLAIKITEVYEHYPNYYKSEIRELYLKHPNLFKFKKLTFSETVEDSKNINSVPQPKVIIAGSGMMNGGRILHHARRYLGDSKSILLFAGFQAAGSLGRRLIEGEQMVRVLGDQITVAAEIRKINGFSAHADNPQLFEFVNATKDTLARVFVVHGEETQALHFVQEIRDRLGVHADAPALYEGFEI